MPRMPARRAAAAETPWAVIHRTLRVATTRPSQFTDLTERIARCVRRSGVLEGLVHVQSTHTTAALLLNENEPLLLSDLQSCLEDWAPEGTDYRHDDFDTRTVNLTPEERPNGHAHARTMLLPASIGLAVRRGKPVLGRWQRIFLVEQDGPRRRTLLVTVMGLAVGSSSASPLRVVR